MGKSAKRKHYPVLDGLRGLGFLIVLVAHVGQAYRSYFIAGKVGVGLFFVLSAFLLTSFFLQKLSSMTRVKDWVHYIMRRIVRLYPMYIVVLCAELFLGKYSPSMVVSHLFLLDGRQHYWTIPVEFQFYALMPVVAFGVVSLLKKDRVQTLIAVVVGLVLYGLFFESLTGQLIRPLASQMNVLFYGPTFLMGVLLAVLHNQPFKVSSNVIRVLMYASLIVTLVSFPYSYKMFTQAKFGIGLFWIFTLYGISWAIIMYGLLHSKSFLRTLLEHQWMRYLGTISYSAYLTHIMVLRFVKGIFPGSTIMGLVVTSVVTIVLSAATYRYIERPALSVKMGKQGFV